MNGAARRAPDPSPPMFDLRAIESILQREDAMRRFQDPKIERRADVTRPFWYIRPVVPVVDPATGKVERKQRNIRLGFCDEMTASEAKREKQARMAQVNSGSWMIQVQLQFGLMVRKFLDARVPQLGPATQAKYRQQIAKHILPDLGALQMSEITAPTLEMWLATKDLARSSKQDLRNVVSAIYTCARRWKLWHGDNPAEGVLVEGAGSGREKRSMTAAAVTRLLDVLATWPAVVAGGFTGRDVRLMLELQIITGLRGSEVRGLKWVDVDWANREVTCRRRWYRGSAAEPKTEASRRTRSVAPLVDELRARLEGLKLAGKSDGEGWIFPGVDGGDPPDDRDLQQHILRPAAEQAGCYFPGFGFHQFRRINITWRQQAGATAIEASKAAGHTKVDHTVGYTLIDVDRDRRQVAKIGARIGRGPKLVRKAV